MFGPGFKIGLTCATVYFGAIAGAAAEFHGPHGRLGVDFWLGVLTGPFAMIGHLVAGSNRFTVHSSEPGMAAVAVTITAALIFVTGAIVGGGAQRVWRSLR